MKVTKVRKTNDKLQLRTLVPLYAWPDMKGCRNQWVPVGELAYKHTPQVGAIINPNSGPNGISDPEYLIAVNRLFNSGAVIFGYVATTYSSRAMRLVFSDILKYRSAGVTNIFLDEVSPAPMDASYYAAIRKQITGHVVYNPGMAVPKWLYGTQDWVVVFESHWKDVQQMEKVTVPSRSVVMALSVPTRSHNTAIMRKIHNLGINCFYSTPDTEPEAYNRTPPWLGDFVT